MTPLDEIARRVLTAERALVISHIMPDGDTIGSALGLAWGLRACGLKVRLSCADAVPSNLTFLPGSGDIRRRRWTNEDIIIAIDASDSARLGDMYDASADGTVPLINIDHHATNRSYGDLNLVRITAATAELVYELLSHMGVALDARIAICLLTALVTDTLCFRTANTTADTLRTAIALSEGGASLPEVTQAVFSHRSMDTLRLWGPALSEARLDGQVLWTAISSAQVDDGVGLASASNGLVSFLGTIDDARVSVIFRELDGHVDVGIRSRPDIDVSGVATTFGGGGHAQAAGCLVEGSLATVRQALLTALNRAVAEQTDMCATLP